MGRHLYAYQHCSPSLPRIPPNPVDSPPSNFDISTTVLVTAIISLVFLIVLVVVLHIYARYLIRHRRRAGHWTAVTIFRSTDASPPVPSRIGLNDADIARIPKFAYKLSSDNPPAECSICLSVVEEGEVVRALPSCKHVFHLECIDMWLHSHPTCPMCRVGAEPPASVAVRVEDGEASEMDGGGGRNGEGTSGSKERLGVEAELVVPKDADQGEVNQESAR